VQVARAALALALVGLVATLGVALGSLGYRLGGLFVSFGPDSGRQQACKRPGSPSSRDRSNDAAMTPFRLTAVPCHSLGTASLCNYKIASSAFASRAWRRAKRQPAIPSYGPPVRRLTMVTATTLWGYAGGTFTATPYCPYGIRRLRHRPSGLAPACGATWDDVRWVPCTVLPWLVAPGMCRTSPTSEPSAAFPPIRAITFYEFIEATTTQLH